MKVIIVGGGFAGINLAKALAGKKEIEVTLVDKNNYHHFPPLLYQVATSFIEASNISYPFRRLFQHKENLRFHNGSLISITPERNKIETDSGILDFDYLVLAIGTETNYFGLENIKKDSVPLKSIDDALRIRNLLLLDTERAARTDDEQERQKLMTIVIAGGGPTGVELAGIMAEMSKNILKKDYPELKGSKPHIYLVDALEQLLSPMSVRSQQEAYKTLSKLGVEIKLNTAVKNYVDGKVILSTGEEIISSKLVWTSGVIARGIPGVPVESIGKGRRIIVDAYNRVSGIKNVFAIGDICFQTTDKNFPNGHPQLAQVAIQQGKLLAVNLENIVLGNNLKPFRYINKGTMAIISKYRAVVDLPSGFYKGVLAWLTWLFIHIIPITGFRNKARLAFNWFWSFVTNDPTLRLIIRPGEQKDQNIKTPYRHY
jgi:NADH:ubiquinone reductase (H+-translocating)